MMDLVLSITESVSQVSLYLSSDAIFVHRGKGGGGGGGGLPQYPATPIHDIMDGLKRGKKGEHTETQSLLQSPNNSITPSCGAHKKEGEKNTPIPFPGSGVLMHILGVEVRNMKPKRMKHNSSENPIAILQYCQKIKH